MAGIIAFPPLRGAAGAALALEPHLRTTALAVLGARARNIQDGLGDAAGEDVITTNATQA